MEGYAVVHFVDTLLYKPEVWTFDYRCFQWIDLIFPAAILPIVGLSL
jgi:hypothetical protein